MTNSIDKVDFDNLKIVHFAEKGSTYNLYNDDGESKKIYLQSGIKTLTI